MLSSMKIFDKLKAIKNILKEIPGIKTYKELDILIEIGYHQEEGNPLTLKQLMLLEIASRATVRRYLNSLISESMVEKFASKNDNRSVMLRLSAPTIKLLTKHYSKLIEQIVENIDSSESGKGGEMDERQMAIESCSCPRPDGQDLVAPLCAVKQYSGGHSNRRNGVLFVNPPPALMCKQLASFGDGHYCMCGNRLHVYLTYGI
jgi:DNA-binding MarR family transcriptional regulator